MTYYTDDMVTLHHGDNRDILATLPSGSVDACVTDPPYELGFMSKGWDGSGIAYDAALWSEVLRVLKPGGHLLAFGGTRTWHRLAVAIEDAGFEIRDSIAWMYGQGFPKSLDVSKAIDKGEGHWRGKGGNVATGNASMSWPNLERTPKGDPITADAAAWKGWGTALKPAHEPVVWARKPFSVVLLWQEETGLHHMIGAMAWLCLLPAKRVETSSPSSPHGRLGEWCVSARVAAATDTSRDGYDATATFRSPEAASTFWSIVSSWSAILGAFSDQTSTSTTSTRSSTTTDLRTLFSLLAPLTSPSTMPACGCLTSGSLSDAAGAKLSSTAAWASWLHTLSASVPEPAIEPIALAVASALAQAAASLSGDPEAASSAASTASTGADARGSRYEPIVVARKPVIGTVAANVLAYGTGALNVDACRIDMGAEYDANRVQRQQNSAGVIDGAFGAAALIGKEIPTYNGKGRWPANVILDESQARELDLMSGVTEARQSGWSKSGSKAGSNDSMSGDNYARDAKPDSFTDTGGGASRFFYTAKANTHERPRIGGSAHPTVKPLTLMRHLVRLVTPPGGIVLEPFAGSGTTLEACIVEGFKCIGIERDPTYLDLIVQRVSKPIQVTLL